MTLINRRRGLLSMGGEAGLLFRRKNVEVEAGGCLDTGVAILQADLDVTVALDFTAASNPGGSTDKGCLYKLLQMGTTRELCIGKYNGGSSKYSCWWLPTSNSDCTEMNNTSPSVGRKRIVVSHEANANGLTVYTKMNDGTVYTHTYTKTFAASDAKLSVGYLSDEGSRGGLPDGTINEISVYSRILSADEIDAFFA